MEKVGTNHLVISGLLDSDEYAKADLLAMHLEQHLDYTIKREGQLEDKWPEYMETKLKPFGIDGSSVEKDKILVFTREYRPIGNFDDFVQLIKNKYGVEIEYPEQRIANIRKMHVEEAAEKVNDAKKATFDKKVDELLENRSSRMENLRANLRLIQKTVTVAQASITELESFNKVLDVPAELLYAVHKYPAPSEDDTSVAADDADTNSVHEEEQNEANESESTLETESETIQTTTTDQTETQQTETEQEQEQETVKEEEASAEAQGEEEDAQNNEEEKVNEQNNEEEDFSQPDPDALDAQLKLQESFKLPQIPQTLVAAQKLKTEEFALDEFVEVIQDLSKKIEAFIADEHFRWKKLEKAVLELKEKIALAISAISINVISKEQIRIKDLEKDISKLDDFDIPEADKDVLAAAALKYAATFEFV